LLLKRNTPIAGHSMPDRYGSPGFAARGSLPSRNTGQIRIAGPARTSRSGPDQGDLPEFVDFDYTARVAKVNGAALWALATNPACHRQGRAPQPGCLPHGGRIAKAG
jgi:hypothetical protein